MSMPENPYAAPRSPLVGETAPELTRDLKELVRVRLGCQLIHYGIMLFLASLVAMVPLMMLLPPEFGAQVAAAGSFLGLLLVYVGPCLCLVVPAQTGARGWLVACTSLSTLGLMPLIVGVNNTSSTLARVTQTGFGVLCWTFALLCFAIFLGRLGAYMDRADLIARARNVTYFLGAMMLAAGGALTYCVLGHTSALRWFVLVPFVVLIGLDNLVTAMAKAIGSRAS